MATRNDISYALYYGIVFYLRGKDQNTEFPIDSFVGGIKRIFNQVQSLYDANEIPVPKRDSGSMVFNLCDLVIKDDTVFMLITCADKKARDTVTTAIKDDVLAEPRIDKKGIQEGSASSNHIAVSLLPNHEKAYLMLIEQVVGINRSLVLSFINQILRQCAKKFPDEYMFEVDTMETDGTGGTKKVPGRAYAKSFGYISEEFSEVLKKGEVKKLEFIGTHDGQWHEKSVEKEVYRVKLKLKKGFYAGIDYLMDLSKEARDKKYQRLKLSFFTGDDIHETADFDITSGFTPVADNYIKKSSMTDFKNCLVGAYVKLNEEIVSKLLSIHKEEHARSK